MIGALVALSVVCGAYATTTAVSGGSTRGDTVQEGPWQVTVKQDGTPDVSGWVWGSQPVPKQGTAVGDPDTYFFEFFSSELGGRFLKDGRSWVVSVDPSKSIGSACPSSSDPKCLRTKSTVKTKTDIYPTSGSATTGYYTNAKQYHADGHYKITALKNGVSVGEADYYIEKVLGFTTDRIEHICASTGFSWPKAGTDAISWEMHWVNDASYPGTCTGKLHHVRVDLNP